MFQTIEKCKTLIKKVAKLCINGENAGHSVLSLAYVNESRIFLSIERKKVRQEYLKTETSLLTILANNCIIIHAERSNWLIIACHKYLIWIKISKAEDCMDVFKFFVFLFFFFFFFNYSSLLTFKPLIMIYFSSRLQKKKNQPYLKIIISGVSMWNTPLWKSFKDNIDWKP